MFYYGTLQNIYSGKSFSFVPFGTLNFVFKFNLVCRLWASDCRPRYQGWKGKLTFVKTPSHILDLLVVILSAIVSIWNQNGHEVFAFRAFRGFHRFFQIIQVIFVKRQIRPWRLFLSVLYDQREQLMIIFYLEIVISSILAYLGFLAEHEVNDDMQTIADFVWWSVSYANSRFPKLT